jgi:multisubunit Na+/H+ antiporter MnhC subunit
MPLSFLPLDPREVIDTDKTRAVHFKTAKEEKEETDVDDAYLLGVVLRLDRLQAMGKQLGYQVVERVKGTRADKSVLEVAMSTQLREYNSAMASLHYAQNLVAAKGISLVVEGNDLNPIMGLTLLDSGANTCIITRQFAEKVGLTIKPSPVVVSIVGGGKPRVGGVIAEPVEVVLALGTRLEARGPVNFLVMEGSGPSVYDILLGTPFLRRHGVYVDPLRQTMVFRPFWQSEGNDRIKALLPVKTTKAGNENNHPF